MPNLFAGNAFRLGLLAAVAAAALAYWAWLPLASPYDTRQLVVLTRPSPTSYYLDAEGKPAGFEYDLIAEFARRQGLNLKVEVADSVSSLIAGMVMDKAHLAAGWLTVTSERAGRVRFGPAYASERELVVCGPGVKLPTSLDQLADVRLEVVQGSSHAERLLEVRQAFPDLRWVEVDTTSTEELLERVANGLSDCTVTDASTFDVVWNYWPKLAVAMDLSESRDIAWVLPKDADMRLRQAVADFFVSIRHDGWLDRLKERYFGHLKRLDEADVEGILSRRGQLLPSLREHFERAQGATGLDWRLLAALAYQESQWNAMATSPTGVRGIMMLTNETADRMGVGNRLNADESILAGARYLAMLKDQLPDRIPDPDRTWMAMAAYNIGMGHLEDARRLAQRLDKDPDAWRDVKDVLPLLAKSTYTNRLRLGYARGGEARILTENVRIYYDILKRFEPVYARATASTGQS
ncbi:membrane-bound lytic murein transglycosylase MltF [Parasulfuritortus cantonensis]|uniref:membrane-bound lytic murein transglycosylase MltF n=1 Tax=Parasulfuritortus cantonensis TaxID=2528202 RepID=UPI00140448B8|nr:membrane-bound lytic murein transglycosylase MltF [Parasulfuritortus cantonensis]